MEEIFSLVEEKHGKHGRDLVIKAHAFMKDAHEGQKRMDGMPFHTHPEFVVKILVEQEHTDPVMLSAALLHDVVEDTDVTMASIKDTFGEEIAFLVDGATDVGKGDGERPILDKYELMRKNHQKMLSYGKKDHRLFLIKSADRIHNLSTMSSLNEEQQQRLSKEAQEFHKENLSRIGEEGMMELIDQLVEDYLDQG